MKKWNNLIALQKHAYSNIEKILPKKKKNENFQIKNSDIFQTSAQNIDYGHSLEPPQRVSSFEYPQSMLLSGKRKNNVYPFKPQVYYIKGVLRESKLYRHVFVMGRELRNVKRRRYVLILSGYHSSR